MAHICASYAAHKYAGIKGRRCSCVALLPRCAYTPCLFMDLQCKFYRIRAAGAKMLHYYSENIDFLVILLYTESVV